MAALKNSGSYPPFVLGKPRYDQVRIELGFVALVVNKHATTTLHYSRRLRDDLNIF